jgi:spore coat polysaccharide biosynthesis protein SpsF
MGSSRFPGKIMKYIEDKVVLQHVVDRCKMSKNIDKIIVATTNKKDDDIIEKYCIDNNILYYRGDENNVLERYYLTTTTFNSDIIIRVTSDCPLIDYNIIDNMIEYFKENNLKFLQPKYFNGNFQMGLILKFLHIMF